MIRRIELDDGAQTLLETRGDGGPLLLCVHGMASSRRSWLRLADRFSDRYRVAAYDQRGHGDSAGMSGPMTLERGVRDFENIVTALGETPYASIGHSWGGAVVLRGGDRSDAGKIVAIDPMLQQCSDTWYAEFIEELDAQFEVTGEGRAQAFRAEYADWHPLDRDGKVHAVAAMTTAPLAGLRDENSAKDWDLRELVATYRKPLLLAMADPSLSISASDTYGGVCSAAARNPNVTLVRFDGFGHNLHREDFDAFAGALAAFVAEAPHGRSHMTCSAKRRPIKPYSV